MNNNFPTPEDFVSQKTEENLRELLNEVNSKAMFDIKSDMHIAYLNQTLENFIINLKETYSNQKQVYEMSGNTFVSRLQFYGFINRVVDNIYPEFNPNWNSQKKYSKYRDPDNELLMY